MPPVTCDLDAIKDPSKWIISFDKALDNVDSSSYALYGVESSSTADCASTSNLCATTNSFVSSGCDDNYLTTNIGRTAVWNGDTWVWIDESTGGGLLQSYPLVYHTDAGTYTTAYSSMDSYEEPLFNVKRRRKINIRFTV